MDIHLDIRKSPFISGFIRIDIIHLNSAIHVPSVRLDHTNYLIDSTNTVRRGMRTNCRLIPILLLVVLSLAPAMGQINMTEPSAKDWFDGGVYYYNIREYNESLQSYQKYLEINPQDAGAWNNKGIDLALLGRTKDALNAFYAAANINTSYAEPWYNMGMIFDLTQDYNNAVQAYNKAIEINPSYKKAWYNKNRDLDRIGIPHTSLYLELTGEKPDNGL